jgi:hypothetical protein
LIDSGGGTNDYGSPGPTNVQSTRKNIAEYLRQGAGASIFDSLFPTQDGDNVQSVSSIPTVRTPNLLGQNPSFRPDRNNSSTASSHTALSFSSKTPAGNGFSNFKPEYEQSSSGLDKPPPPPYPFLGFRFFFNGGLESGGGGNILLFIKLFIPANAGSVCNKFTSSGLVVGGTPLIPLATLLNQALPSG